MIVVWPPAATTRHEICVIVGSTIWSPACAVWVISVRCAGRSRPAAMRLKMIFLVDAAITFTRPPSVISTK
jgi:hypothetical protein